MRVCPSATLLTPGQVVCFGDQNQLAAVVPRPCQDITRKTVFDHFGLHDVEERSTWLIISYPPYPSFTHAYPTC